MEGLPEGYEEGDSLVDDRPVVLITTVDIGGGESDRIVMRRGDSAASAAREFVQRHGLSESVLGPLTRHMHDNLIKAKREAKARKQELDLMRAAEAAAAAAGDYSASTSPSRSAPHTPPESLDSPTAPREHRGDRASPPPALPPAAARPMLSFDERLSAKLMPVDKSRLVSTVSAADMGRNRSSQLGLGMNMAAMGRTTRSADPSPRDSVHLRLYGLAADQARRLQDRREVLQGDAEASAQHARLRMSWISEEMMRERTAGPFENYGEMLYAEGLETSASRRVRAEAERAERASHELDGVTFRPATTAMAARLEMEPAWTRLSNGMRKQTLERLEEMRQAKEAAEVSECSFHPSINKHSSNMMEERAETLKALNLTSHEQLYQDASRRQEKMAALAQWHPDDVTFHPAINQSITAQSYLRSSWERGSSVMSASGSLGGVNQVVDRLYAAGDKYKTRMDDARAKYQGPCDAVTGRPLFQPEVNRSPKAQAVQRNKDGKPIGEYLYSVAQELADKKAGQLELEAKTLAAEASKSHATSNSQRLFRTLKLKRFRQIFEYLNEAGASSLDLATLVRCPTDHMDNLDNEVRADVELAADIWARFNDVPLGADEDTERRGSVEVTLCPPLTFERFAAVMEEALAQRRKPRNYLVPSPSGKAAPSYSFRPRIDRRSKAMAEARLRPAECSANLYDLLHKTAETTREKLDFKRREAEERSIAGCTFAPQLNQPRGKQASVEGRALAMAGGRPWSTGITGSAASDCSGSPRGGCPGSPGGAASSQYDSEAHLIEVATFEALEQEVVAMERHAQQQMGGAHGTRRADRPESMAGAEPTSPTISGGGGGSQGHMGAQASSVLRAQLGADVASEDVAATEAMLLDLLAGASVPGTAPATVGSLLQRFLAENGMAVEGGGVGPPTTAFGTLGAADAGAAVGGGGSPNNGTSTFGPVPVRRRSTKDSAASSAAVNLYVVPSFGEQRSGNLSQAGAADPLGGGGRNGGGGVAAMMGKSLQELATTLAAWDPVAEPTMVRGL